MKNKKILLVLLTVVVIAVTAIALAGCNDRPDKVFAGTAADLNGFTSAMQIYRDASSISAIDGTDLLFVTENLAEGNNKYILYNFVTDDPIAEFTAGSANYQSMDCGAIGVYKTDTINSIETTEIKVFDIHGTALNGNFVTTTQFDRENYGITSDCVIINNIVYIVDGGELITSFEKTPSFDPVIANYEYESDNYFYYKHESYIRVFEKNGNLHTVADVSDNEYASTSKTSVFYLSEDKIVVQYTDRCADDENSYDYLENGSKYEVRTYIFDAKKSKWSEKKSFKYVIDNIEPAEHEGAAAFDESITDIMIARKFSKKTLSDHYTLASVNDSLKVKIDFDDVFEGYIGHRAFADGYLIETMTGKYFIAKDGKDYVKATVYDLNSQYFDNGSGVIYKYESGKINEQGRYDVSKYSVVSVVGGNVLYLGNDGKYYVGTLGAEPAVLSTDTVTVRVLDGFYTLTDSTVGTSPVVSLYSAGGTKLCALGGAVANGNFASRTDVNGNEVRIISVTGVNGTMYYRLGYLG